MNTGAGTNEIITGAIDDVNGTLGGVGTDSLTLDDGDNIVDANVAAVENATVSGVAASVTMTLAQHNAYVLENGFKGSLFMSARSGENVVRAFYKAAGELLHMPLTEGELEEHTKVLKVELQGAAGSHDGGRTAFADQIEQEDREAAEAAAAARKANDEACMCVVC